MRSGFLAFKENANQVQIIGVVAIILTFNRPTVIESINYLHGGAPILGHLLSDINTQSVGEGLLPGSRTE
jgi:hypothetical protein